MSHPLTRRTQCAYAVARGVERRHIGNGEVMSVTCVAAQVEKPPYALAAQRIPHHTGEQHRPAQPLTNDEDKRPINDVALR